MKTILSGALALTLLAGGALAQATYVPGGPGEPRADQHDFQRGPGDGPPRDRGQMDGQYGDHQRVDNHGYGENRGYGYHHGYGYGYGYHHHYGRQSCTWHYHHRVCRWVR